MGRWPKPGWILLCAGQLVAVYPAADMVVVMTGSDPELPALFAEHLRPSDLSEEPLEPRPRHQELLARFARELEDPEPLDPQLPPGMAGMVSGERFVFDQNPLGIGAITLHFPSGPAAEAEIELEDAQGGGAYAVGLDGLCRFNDLGAAGVMLKGNRVALRGRWISGRTFQVDFVNMGDPIYIRSHLTFQGDELMMRVNLRPVGVNHELTGRRSP